MTSTYDCIFAGYFLQKKKNLAMSFSSDAMSFSSDAMSLYKGQRREWSRCILACICVWELDNL